MQNRAEGFPDRRRGLRFPFLANAEIQASDGATQLKARVTDLSLFGCYVDVVNPLPVGSDLVIRIFGSTEIFESRATVRYSHANLGMGLAFRDVKPFFLPVLKKWLAEAANRAVLSRYSQ
jgi:hypothetical protein